ncbi:MAG: hypothetical protein E5V65_17695, partial [Mesorhizobium sp.]
MPTTDCFETAFRFSHAGWHCADRFGLIATELFQSGQEKLYEQGRRQRLTEAGMRLGGRLAAAIEVLEDIGRRHRPVADALRDWGLSHRFA